MKEGISRGRIEGWPKHKQHNELAPLLGKKQGVLSSPYIGGEERNPTSIKINHHIHLLA
jgi:hypothetical protein